MKGADWTWKCGCYSFCGTFVPCPEHAPKRPEPFISHTSIDLEPLVYDPDEWVDDGGDSVKRKEKS